MQQCVTDKMVNQQVSAVIMGPLPLLSPYKLMGYIKVEEFLNNQIKKKAAHARKKQNLHEIFGTCWILTSRKGEKRNIKL